MTYKSAYASSPLVLILLDGVGRVVHSSKVATDLLGAIEEQSINDFVDDSSGKSLAEMRIQGDVNQEAVGQVIRLHGLDNKDHNLPCMIDFMEGKNGSRLQRITAIYNLEGQVIIDRIVRSEDLLRGLVQTSTEAMWCIEYTEPVDLTVEYQEIIRQVFENDCHWMMCNDAMARLYDLPEGMDFNRQQVSLYFRRNPENEAFVRQIIESNFCIDNALSIDSRHDGTTIYVENTVRADTEGGLLRRLWGTVRDVTGYKQAYNVLRQQIRDVRSILSAIPDVVLVIDRNLILVGVNPAFERTLGWKASQLLGKNIQTIINLEKFLPPSRSWSGMDSQRWTTEVLTYAGVKLLCDVQVAPIGEEATDQFVMTLRSVQLPNVSPPELQ